MFPSEQPRLFDKVPPALLGPLSSGQSALYWEILARYYQLEFEREPFVVVKTVALEVAEDILRASRVWQERREEILSDDSLVGLDAGEATGSAANPAGVSSAASPAGVSSAASPAGVSAATSPAGVSATEGPAPSGPGLVVDASQEAFLLRATTRRLVARLERSGWFHFEYRSSLGHVLNFYPYAARILEALIRVARDEQPVFQGYAHTIASILKPEAFAAKPGVSLAEARRHTVDLVRELKILDRNIYAFTQRLLDEVASAAGVLEEGIDHYRQAVLANYHRLKTVDNLFKWRGEILYRLERVERDPLLREAAARWYAEQYGLGGEAAARRVAEDLHLLETQFEQLPDLIDDIDSRNARFSGVALRKILYLLRQDRRIEGQLQLLIDRLARDQTPELQFDVYRCELLADGFLYTPPKRRAQVTERKLRRGQPANVAALTRAVAPRLRRPFSRARVEQYVGGLLAARPRVSVDELELAADEDYVRLMYIAAYGLDEHSPFLFQRFGGAGEPRLHHAGIYGFPPGELRKRTSRKEPH